MQTEVITILGNSLTDLTTQIKNACDIRLVQKMGLKASAVIKGDVNNFPVMMVLVFQPTSPI